MKKCFMILLFVLPVSFAMSQEMQKNSKAGLGKKEQEIWSKVVDLNNQVFGTKDSVIIASLLSANVHYGHSGGNIENKSAMVHNASVSQTIYKDVTNEMVSIKLIDKVAVVRYILKAKSVEKEMETPLELGIIQVWQNEKGKWQLLERQAVKLNVKKA